VYVTAIHQITDPEKFQQAVRAATPPVREFPAGIVLHSTFSNVDGTKAVCLWEAETVEAARDLVDSAVGQFSRNEYFEVSKKPHWTTGLITRGTPARWITSSGLSMQAE
jgi:hypothetical protein